MRVTAIATAAFLLLSEITAKQLDFRPRGTRWRRTLDDDMRRDAFNLLERRQSESDPSVQPSQPTTTPPNNATIAATCLQGLSSITTVSNHAGITACYNILSSDLSTNIFNADLRLYRAGTPSGSFASVSPSNMMVSLTYAPVTTFDTIVTRPLHKRQTSGMTEMDQYSLILHVPVSMDLSKLNTTEMLSLIVPSITLNSVDSSSNSPISTNISTTDIAYFTTGAFQSQFSPPLITTHLQQLAIQASSKFVLPGQTLGIFPTGLIVTSAWMVLFFLACGVGTIGRVRNRGIYRRRKAAVGSRVGKRYHG